MSKPSNSNNGMTDEEKSELDEAYNACHSHTNTSVLAAITASFTIAMKTAVNNLISGIITSGLSISGYTKLGENATAIKTKQITGNTPSTGSTNSYTTGMTASNIVSFIVTVWDANGIIRPTCYGEYSTFAQYYLAYIGTDGKLYIEVPTTGTEVSSCAFSCLITYSE